MYTVKLINQTNHEISVSALTKALDYVKTFKEQKEVKLFIEYDDEKHIDPNIEGSDYDWIKFKDFMACGHTHPLISPPRHHDHITLSIWVRSFKED